MVMMPGGSPVSRVPSMSKLMSFGKSAPPIRQHAATPSSFWRTPESTLKRSPTSKWILDRAFSRVQDDGRSRHVRPSLLLYQSDFGQELHHLGLLRCEPFSEFVRVH